ncbi:MAG: hypothetical protein KDD64_14505, partial [Bdellovibrionales bacterium]|nr:hypothetical protein [Bdellovibrionales bacterium]
MRRRVGSDDDKKTVVRLWLVNMALIVGMFSWIIYNGMWNEMWNVVTSTPAVLFVFGGLAGWGVFCWRRSENFSNAEAAVFVAMMIPLSYISTAFAFYWLTDLGDREVWNSEVVKVEWEEEYYTESKDEDGDTDRTYWGPYYRIFTAAGEEVSTDKARWSRYVQHWGGQGRVTSRRNLTADGEGLASDHDFKA